MLSFVKPLGKGSIVRRLVRLVAVLAVVLASSLSMSGCGPVKVNVFTCEGSIANPHGSKGSPGWMLAKARAKCYGNGKIRYVEIRTQMQQKVKGTWVTRNSLIDRKEFPKLAKYYTTYTKSMRCARGTFRARVKLSGKLVGGKTIAVSKGGWVYSEAVRNPCS